MARGRGDATDVGCDVWIENRKNRDQPSRLLLLCRSKTGYLQFVPVAYACIPRNHLARPRGNEAQWLTGESVDGLIALSGAAFGDVGRR